MSSIRMMKMMKKWTHVILRAMISKSVSVSIRAICIITNQNSTAYNQLVLVALAICIRL